MHALGVTAVLHLDPEVRAGAMSGYERAIGQRSRWCRATAFASLGAAEVVAHDPGHSRSISFLRSTADTMAPLIDDGWRWPEARLAYANATLAESLIATGWVLGRDPVIERGLVMLRWLLDMETRSGHLSVAPVGGRGPGDPSVGFDQQPIEVSAMADACWRAYTSTGDAEWLSGVRAADRWFAGDNDGGVAMSDPLTGGGYDGLGVGGVNLNQGAESTLAYVSTCQRARSVLSCR